MMKTEQSELEKEEKEIAKLQERKLELEVLIKSVELNLIRHGYEIIPSNQETRQNNSTVFTKKSLPQPGIRIHNKLSNRGIEKCQELYTRLDEDGDGLLNWIDMRVMKSLSTSSTYGLIQDPMYLRHEAWIMAMNDLNIYVDENGFISREEFIKYRQLIELNTPLSTDLLSAKIGYLPRLLRRWIRVKDRIKNCLEVRSLEDSIENDTDQLDLNEVSFILNSSSSELRYSKHDFKVAMCFISRFDSTMTHLLSKSLRRDLFLEVPEKIAGETGGFYGGRLVQPVFTMSREYVSFVRPEALIGWIYSRRLPPSEGILYRTLLGIKYRIWRGIREMYKTSYYLWDIGLHIRERLIFKQPSIPSIDEVDMKPKSSIRLSCQVGTPTGTEDGTNIYWKFSKVENLPNYLASLSLPKDIGSGIVIDLSRRLDEEDNVENEAYLTKTCMMIKTAILHHYGDELQRTPHFRGIFIFPTINETDQMKVIRICLGFKRTISLDSYLKMVGIPYGTDDIFTHCYGEVSLNMHLMDIIENVYTAFDTSFFFNGSAFIEFHSVMVLKVLEAIKVAFAAGLNFDSVFNSRAAKKGTDPDPWIHLRPHFPEICFFCDKIITHIKGLKTFNHSFVYTKASDVLERLFGVVEWIQRYVPKDIFSKTGAIPTIYEKFCLLWNEQINSLYQRFRSSLISKQDAREVERRRRMNLTQRQRDIEAFKASQNNILHKLAQLGVNASEKDMYDDETKTPEQYAADVAESQCDSDLYSYELYERLSKTCQGIHQIDILLGKSRVAISFTGMDIMDLFPKPPSIIQIRKECEEREIASKHQEDLATSMFQN